MYIARCGVKKKNARRCRSLEQCRPQQEKSQKRLQNAKLRLEPPWVLHLTAAMGNRGGCMAPPVPPHSLDGTEKPSPAKNPTMNKSVDLVSASLLASPPQPKHLDFSVAHRIIWRSICRS